MSSQSSSTVSMSPQVLIQEKNHVRTVVLNRPKQLNALSEYMISRLLELFLAYEVDPHVKLIILKGNGRAFCAGGDLMYLAPQVHKGNWRAAAKYYKIENTLNYVLATYKKPQVSILNGIVMGGGVGISVHGTFRIVTENTVFAMPETAIGLFPDVGASYFLSRLPGFFGEYVGLTGSRLDGAEMRGCGLATHFVPSVKLPLLEEELIQASLSDADTIRRIIDKYAEQPSLKESSACRQLFIINSCFSRATVEEILSSLEHENSKRNCHCISTTIQLMKRASPTSLKISLKSIREGRSQGIDECLIREYRAICNMSQGEINKDFLEGTRAMIFVKDNNPKWNPSSLDQVTESMVDRHFSRSDDEEWEDLELADRTKLPVSAILSKL